MLGQGDPLEQKYPLEVYGYHGAGRTHSTYHNVPWLRALHPDELVYGLLANGFTEKCYDGKAFFATDHPVGKDKASNKGTAKLSMDAYKTARTSMMSLKNSKGRPLALVPDLLVVPPALEADARDILVADFINGTKNTMQGTAEIHVEPRLASDSAWFLLCTKRPVKPLIYQQRKKAKFVSKTNETDDNVFMSKKFIYGADSRGNAGFGFWPTALTVPPPKPPGAERRARHELQHTH